MNRQEPYHPSLIPSFPLASKQTARVMTNVKPAEPHYGWYSRGYLPHWDHPGMIQSINFRLADSLPTTVIEKWNAELSLGALASRRRVGMCNFSCKTRQRDAGAPKWNDSPNGREVELRRRIEEYLDAGHGHCWLKQPGIALLVERALFHFDAQRYRLLAWCIMPNHVHVLIETREGFPLRGVLHSWKSFTSHEANTLLRRSGEFWQREYLDRFVRNAEHYEKVVAYIEENPVKAGLAKVKCDWLWSSARFHATVGHVTPLGNAAAPAACFEKEPSIHSPTRRQRSRTAS